MKKKCVLFITTIFILGTSISSLVFGISNEDCNANGGILLNTDVPGIEGRCLQKQDSDVNEIDLKSTEILNSKKDLYILLKYLLIITTINNPPLGIIIGTFMIAIYGTNSEIF